MANKPLKSVQFPGLDDTYTIPAVDTTLAVTGAAADSKKVGDELTELKADFNNKLYSQYSSDNYVTGSVSAQGEITTTAKSVRSELVEISAINQIVKPVGILLRRAYYADNDTSSWLGNVDNTYTKSSTLSMSDIQASYPTAKYVIVALKHYDGSAQTDFIPSDVDSTGFKLIIENSTLWNNTYNYVLDVQSQYFSFENKELTASTSITVAMGSDKLKNMIVKANAMYDGDTPPTIHFARRWYNSSGTSLNRYYGSPFYVVGGDGTYKQQEWRVPPWFYGAEKSLIIDITIPSGTKLYIKELENVYDDSISREGCGINLNAHGYCGFGGPHNTLYSFAMAAKLGYKYCITIPKVTSDGVYVCLHDDDSIQSSARNDDGTAIAEEYQNHPVSYFTYNELLQFDFGIYRGQPFKGERIPLLSDFFKICSVTGMHPMLSVHPNLSGHWENIKAMAEKYGVLKTLNIKAALASIEYPMAVLGADIESYTIDTDSASSITSDFDTLTETYGLENVKRVIEFKYSAITDALISDALSAGYIVGVYDEATHNITDKCELIDKGVTEFSEDYNASVGLNWI